MGRTGRSIRGWLPLVALLPVAVENEKRDSLPAIGQLLIIGFDGTEMSPRLASLLAKIQPAGVILFARNFETPPQLRRLTAEIRALRDPDLIILHTGAPKDYESGHIPGAVWADIDRGDGRFPARALAWRQLSYNAGRVTTYALLGAAAGGAGGALLSAADGVPLLRFLYLVANVFLLALALGVTVQGSFVLLAAVVAKACGLHLAVRSPTGATRDSPSCSSTKRPAASSAICVSDSTRHTSR